MSRPAGRPRVWDDPLERDRVRQQRWRDNQKRRKRTLAIDKGRIEQSQDTTHQERRSEIMSFNVNRKGERIALVRNKLNEKPVDIISADEDEPSRGSFPQIDVKEYEEIVPIVPLEGRQCFYIAGRSGSGKTVLANKICQIWKDIHPDGEMFLLSLKEPEQSSSLSMENEFSRIELDKDLVISVKNGLNVQNFPENCLVLADDFDSVSDKKVKDATFNLINNLLKVGRERGITVIITSHNLSNYSSTRTIISECPRIILFPRYCANHTLMAFCRNYIGLVNNDVHAMKKLDSRWVMINNGGGRQWIVHEKGGYFI